MAQVGPKNRKGPAARRQVVLHSSTSLEDAESQVPDAFRGRAFKASADPRRKASIRSLVVTAFIVPGLFATVALPAYAFAPASDATAAVAPGSLQQLKETNAQSVVVSRDAAAASIARDAFSATSAAEMTRATLAVTYASYTGPSAADYLANPSYPSFDLAQVAAVAQQYIGTPYVYGGSNPSGFDCSGFVLFVYAQFGVSLPHSVSGSAAAGTRISRDAAVPGDLVILPGHSGIYMGGGMFIDSPDYGRTIQVRPIYEDDYYIVRIGI